MAEIIGSLREPFKGEYENQEDFEKRKEQFLEEERDKLYWRKFQWNVALGVFGALVLWSILMMIVWFVIYAIMHSV